LNGQLTSEISRLFFEGGYFWNPNASTILATEFLPVLNRMRDWHWNSELNLTTKLSDLFRLKTAYGFRYAHTPVNATLQQWDQLFTTSLVAEF
jgi:putative salt-induced outer membrane protein YdiY